MDFIDLQVVPIETELPQALDIMRTVGQSGIVAVEKGTHWLFSAGWVVVGIVRGRKTLGDVETRCRVEIVKPPPSVQTTIPQDVEDFLDSVSHNYMLFSPGPVLKTTKVVTRQESLARVLSLAPSNCYCTNPNRPSDPQGYNPPLPAGNTCTFDGSPIVCA